jgi:hypothetical protein
MLRCVCPMLLLAGVVFCFAGRGVAWSALFLWDVSKSVQTSLLSVQVLWKALVLFSIRFGSSRKVAIASWLFKADALHLALLWACAYRHTSGGRWKSGELGGERVCPGTKYSVSWVGCSKLLKLWGQGLEVRPFFLLWPGYVCKRL